MITGNPSVAVIGGGLAGLAAGCALADVGCRVTLFERRPYLGGRASSYELPGTGEVVDNCQHVLVGCCTNLIDFYQRIGVDDKIRWYDRLTFIEPGGRRSVIGESPLPAPFHNAFSFLRARSLSFADKLAIIRALLAIVRRLPQDSGEPFADWLRHHGQTERAISRFWQTVLVSALNEDLDRVSVSMAAMVFRESFLKSAQAGRMGVPRVPLTELYEAAGNYVRERGGEVLLRTAVSGIARAQQDDEITLCINGEQHRFEYAVIATPFSKAADVLPQLPEFESLRRSASQFESSPITGIHLWFDRQITDLDHAVLLDRTIQWMFHKSKILDCHARADGSYVELVVSSSKALVEKSRQEIIDLALHELAEFFPVVNQAKLLKATVIKEVHATFSPRPGLESYRPAPETPWARLFLAGDWVATGWPATMEGAVRSGYMAAEALARAIGEPRRILVPDLPPQGFMRLFG
jgi:zeta-carotene desaturase